MIDSHFALGIRTLVDTDKAAEHDSVDVTQRFFAPVTRVGDSLHALASIFSVETDDIIRIVIQDAYETWPSP